MQVVDCLHHRTAMLTASGVNPGSLASVRSAGARVSITAFCLVRRGVAICRTKPHAPALGSS
jgi:hypothetical protein